MSDHESDAGDKSVVEDEQDSEVDVDENGEIHVTCRKNFTSLFKRSDHSVNKVYLSEVPELCKNEPCQLGVDEAGRGPVLGAMVYGIAYAPLSEKQLLVDLGCADSKTLTEEKRDIIFDEICKNKEKMGWAVEAISPNFISNSMFRRSKSSLNEVSMNSAIGLIKSAIEAGVHVREVYVDTVGLPEKYQAKLKGIFPDLKIVVAKKADSTYPIVSAASICAKVARDHAVRAWQFREGSFGAQYGSGYPNDPVTKEWLKSNVDSVFGFPQIVRSSWSTAEKIMEAESLSVEWEDVEEAENQNEQKILKFFAKSTPQRLNQHKASHTFFTERCISNATTL